MKHLIQGVGRRAHRAPLAHATYSALLCLLLLATVVFSTLVLGLAPAAGKTAPVGQAAATPSAGSSLGANPGATPGVSSAPNAPNAPNAQATAAPAVPPAAGTAVAPAPNPATTAVAPPPGSNLGTQSTATPTSVVQGASSNGFPLWVIVPVAAVLLGGLAFAFLRTRRPITTTAVTTTTTATAPVGPMGATPMPPASTPVTEAALVESAPVSTPLDDTAVNVTEIAPVIDPIAVAPALAAAPVTATAPEVSAMLPGRIECPNCGTLNDIDENFCHECGQDLRPTRAQLMAAMPAEVVDEYTPYLETLGRVDDQLEYVLSRPRILIGTAPNNDIVIDTAFKGSATVSRGHAELRRQGAGFTIIDKGSGAGTYVNNTRVTENPLLDNDQVRIGDVRFIYHAPARPTTR